MGLNPDYVIAPSLQMYFVDKTTGLPLANGQVFFYIDGTNIPKPVYELSGTPTDYSYTVLPNPVILSGVGTFQDEQGNDILPYYFPFDSLGNIQLYTVQVFDQNGVLQFTRNGWPNFTTEVVPINQDVTNYIPNGQFLLHNNVPASAANGYKAGVISQAVTQIAPGGWTFERNVGSSATDIITFIPLSATTIPSGNPPFQLQVQTTVAGTDTIKDIRLKFPGVNTFASTSEPFNFYFEGSTPSGSVPVQIIVHKFYGSSGSAATDTVVGSFTLTPNNSSFTLPILFGTNVGKVIAGGDDFVQIALRLPPTSTQTVLVTDFALTNTDEVLQSFPIQTHAQQIDPSTAGFLPVPDPNGFSLYLPVVLAQTGFVFDNSPVGKISQSIYTNTYNTTNNFPQLLCDGTQFVYANYSSVGIPYARLGNVLISDSPVANTPKYGTGPSYATAYAYAGTANSLRLTVNSAGTISGATDGNTGWTFGNAITGIASINYTAYNNVANAVLAIGNFSSANAPASAGTSGFTITNQTDPSGGNFYGNYAIIISAIKSASTLTNTGGGGKYFQFSNHTVSFYMWFKVTNETDPAPGGTGIQVNLLPTATTQDVANIIREAINCFEATNVTVTGLPTASQYWLFSADPSATNNFYVWYQVNGVGGDPMIASRTGIKVNLVSADTNASIVTKTLTAINQYQFAVPDFRGMFARMLDPNATYDIDVAQRWSTVSGLSGANLGTYEFQAFLSHAHGTGGSSNQFISNTTVSGAYQNGGTYGQPVNGTAQAGGSETRPVNFDVNFYIGY